MRLRYLVKSKNRLGIFRTQSEIIRYVKSLDKKESYKILPCERFKKSNDRLFI